MIRKMIPYVKPVGEPYSGKLGRTVRRGAVGKVLLDSNSLAAYPTAPARRNFGIIARY